MYPFLEIYDIFHRIYIVFNCCQLLVSVLIIIFLILVAILFYFALFMMFYYFNVWIFLSSIITFRFFFQYHKHSHQHILVANKNNTQFIVTLSYSTTNFSSSFIFEKSTLSLFCVQKYTLNSVINFSLLTLIYLFWFFCFFLFLFLFPFLCRCLNLVFLK